ncbi:hypothetical protein HS088_TW21G00764 [Tripterygium wilfordii]|uniref:Cysteine-rich receptor-like protein kinase 10 n=2 Tax=Tripterygium wilfordii TaxID=458696 RepID=A0A7J7C4C2_TRIWF|nr:hypothetical protein HS088_TW21G00764 [Tripterygium wilfordii]
MVFSRVAFLVFLSFLLFISFTNSQLAPLYHQCSKLQGNHTPSSTYNSNLKNLLSSLISNTDIDYGFYNFSLGQGSDKVYAVGLCRGDINPTSCRSCIRMSTDQLTELCPSQNEATIVYDNCTLRYSNRSIFRDTFSSEPYFSEYNSSKVPDVEQFSEAVRSLLFSIRDKAPLGSSLRKFATGKADFGNSRTIYALTQCTPDLAYYDCYNCLESAVTYYPNFIGNTAGRIYFPSCYARYDMIQFYETASDTPPAPATHLSPPPSSGSTTKGMILRIILPTVGFGMISCTFCCCLVSHKRNKKNKTANKEIATEESLQFELGTIEAATNKFSDDDKIGVGGFGNVYKGTLPNGQKIAVKRLSRSSGQGVQEFKNEVELVAKLQHRNLVRLLGFCLERDEKILIYEFVPNKSLDCLLFDPEKQGKLDWSRRYKIIEGTARGLLYLHQDSPLKIIHRDLKTSNILLDEAMEPKIADFGMARMIGFEQNQERTNRIVGTYGYMPPEYAIRGKFSVKSDVYSFGVVVLEIISGKKNSSFYQSDFGNNLLSFAWRHWRDGTSIELMDSTLGDSYSESEIIRCIQIALLCVQEDPAARPTMGKVVSMLISSSVRLPLPQQPAFYVGSRTGSNLQMLEVVLDNQSTAKSTPSVNEASVTEVLLR